MVSGETRVRVVLPYLLVRLKGSPEGIRVVSAGVTWFGVSILRDQRYYEFLW